MKHLNFLSIFLLVLVSCSTKMVTYYDIDKTQTIGISNRMYEDSILECLGTFFLFSGGNTKVYEGIGLELTFMKDTSAQTEELDIKIKPTKHTNFVSPLSFGVIDIGALEQIKGKNFNAVKAIINNSKDKTVTILFKDNVEKYDSLYADVRILILTNDKRHKVSQNKIYLKGYFRKQFTR